MPQTNAVRGHFQYDEKVRIVQEYLHRERIDDAIIWVYHPGFGEAALRLERKLLVYDCVDEYTAFPAYKDCKEWLAAREEQLCRRADLVFTTAPALYERKRVFNPEGTHYVHNVGDADHFKQALAASTAVPADLAALPKPLILFVGAVSNYKLNIDWLLELAQEPSELSFGLDRADRDLRSEHECLQAESFAERARARHARLFRAARIPQGL